MLDWNNIERSVTPFHTNTYQRNLYQSNNKSFLLKKIEKQFSSFVCSRIFCKERSSSVTLRNSLTATFNCLFVLHSLGTYHELWFRLVTGKCMVPKAFTGYLLLWVKCIFGLLQWTMIILVTRNFHLSVPSLEKTL